jgi:hypothetical protein
MTPQKVFIGCPTHDGRIDSRTALAISERATQKHQALVSIQTSSLLAHNCNLLWCAALNVREKYGIKWFAMIHADVIPETWWLDRLIDIADKHQADLLSAVIPIKTPDGLTSTALSRIDGTGVQKRLTQTEVNSKDLPETFDLSMVSPLTYGNTKLLVNTGCMICRLDRIWSDELYFTINDKVEKKFNQYFPTVEPEDWFFSKLVAEKGGKVMATKAITVQHIGTSLYNSRTVWGHATDPNAEL